ncbi:hypothetical protein ABFX02_11G043300 [Erythranthe guttata]
MELRLELTLSSGSGQGPDPNLDSDENKKRVFDNAFLAVAHERRVDTTPFQTLPLLTWDVCDTRVQKLYVFNRNAEEENRDFVVGWPPVRNWRKQFCDQNRRRGCAANYVNVENGGGGGGGGRLNSKYVKVKMEGVGIARKIDLRTFQSFHTLTHKLMALFGKCEEHVEEFEVTYQDKEGDWLLARDVPWEIFVQSVQRIKLQKNGI